MRELAFERAFRGWAEARGVGWSWLEYLRPAAGGSTTALHLVPPAPPRGLVLVLHGAGNDALFSFVGLFKRILDRGLSVFSFHVDGHGRGLATRFSAATSADAAQAALDRSGAAADGLPVHALGVSLGGAVLLRALPDLAPRPATATLMVAPLRIEFSRAAFLGELGPGLLATVWREREHYGLSGLIPSFGPFKRDVYPLRLATPRPGAFGYVEALNEELRRMRLEDAARRVGTPTLLVYGTDDRLVPHRHGERLRELIDGAELLTVARGTHLTTPLSPLAVQRFLHVVSAGCQVPSAKSRVPGAEEESGETGSPGTRDWKVGAEGEGTLGTGEGEG